MSKIKRANEEKTTLGRKNNTGVKKIVFICI
jgi:hypothetical protein